MPTICPICNKEDAIQKVSIVVASGTSSGSFSGPTGGVTYSDGKWGSVSGYQSSYGTLTSNLALALRPPQAPNKPSGFGFMWVLIILALIGSGVCVYNLLFGIAMSIIFGLSQAGNYGNSNQLSPGSLVGVTVSGLFVTTLVFGGLIFVLIKLIRADANKKNKKMPQYTAEKIAWDKAIKTWNRMFFCFRDGVVFDPTTNETCNVEKIQQFLYK